MFVPQTTRPVMTVLCLLAHIIHLASTPGRAGQAMVNHPWCATRRILYRPDKPDVRDYFDQHHPPSRGRYSLSLSLHRHFTGLLVDTGEKSVSR